MHLLSATRRARSLTQADVASMAQISLPTLRSLERGEGGVHALVAVMAVLGLRWGWAPERTQAAAMLAAQRRAKGLSQAELAVRIGVSRPTVIALERDLGATVATVLKVARLLGMGSVVRAAPSGRGGLVPAKNAPAQDLVMTPPELAAAVIGHFSDRMAGRVLDPARGQGAFHDGFPTHLDRHWCEIGEGRDFFDWQQPVDRVMTNPPWSRLREFTRHAMRIAPNIVWACAADEPDHQGTAARSRRGGVRHRRAGEARDPQGLATERLSTGRGLAAPRACGELGRNAAGRITGHHPRTPPPILMAPTCWPPGRPGRDDPRPRPRPRPRHRHRVCRITWPTSSTGACRGPWVPRTTGLPDCPFCRVRYREHPEFVRIPELWVFRQCCVGPLSDPARRAAARVHPARSCPSLHPGRQSRDLPRRPRASPRAGRPRRRAPRCRTTVSAAPGR
ncbi:hypothetical protein CDV54_21230 [Paracoccus yeei]|nr:hypothetical protein CDV54_21230 [Paracoccus yeei]